MKCDILVIGGGGSGLVAAARAAEVSGKKVIVLEKSPNLGGGMLLASTMRTFRSKWQKERGIPDQTVDFIRRMMDLTLWRLDPKLVRNAILATGAFFDWYSELEDPEILAAYEPRPYIFDIPVGGQVGPQVDGFHNGSGRLFVAAMLRRCRELGVEILTRHRAVDIHMEQGKIVSVEAETPDGRVTIGCSRVILSSGSWIRNRAVVEKVMPAFLEMEVAPSAHLNPNYTGDGLTLAEKAGAALDWDSFCLRLMGPMCSTGEESEFDPLTHSPYCVCVDLEGRRFAAEPMASRMDPFDAGHVLLHIPKGKSWFILSADVLERIIDQSRQPQDPGPFAMRPLPDVKTIDGWFRQARDRGERRIAFGDTPQALAGQIGMDPSALAKTLEDYDRCCAQGEDTAFFKLPEHLLPLGEGPYYAVEGCLGTDGAFGGIRVDPEMRAYGPNGELTQGLYVTGDIASGRHIVLGGIKRQVLNDMSWALASGFLAGEAAAKSAMELP